MHSRKIPNGDIDHLAIAPSGIYVIDAKNYTGRIEARDVGNWRTVDLRLYVGGRDKSKLLEGKPLSFGPVSCLWAKKLCELIKQSGPLDPSQRYSIAALLSVALPAAS